MALDSYANLKTAVATWTGRADLDASGVIDDGIDMFEAWVNRNIRHRSMIKLGTGLVMSGNDLVHPADWLEWYALENNSNPRDISITTDEALESAKTAVYTGNTRFAVVRATSTELYPAPTVTTNLTARYYAALPALSGTTTSNWLLASHPDVYLAGVITSMAIFTQDDPRFVTLSQMLATGLQELKREGESVRFGGSVLQIRNV